MYSARDHDEEFEPLPGYDAGYVDTEANIGLLLVIFLSLGLINGP